MYSFLRLFSVHNSWYPCVAARQMQERGAEVHVHMYILRSIEVSMFTLAYFHCACVKDHNHLSLMAILLRRQMTWMTL